jgi:S-adenosylmethionine:tRNA ribosyltransferase-isomerase
MKKSDFQFDLPSRLIAQYPKERGESKLFILHRSTGEFEHKKFRDIIKYIKKGDCIVVNDTKVIPARFYGFRESTGGKLELLLIEKIKDKVWKVLISPGKKGRIGDVLILEDRIKCRVEGIIEKTGERIVIFEDDKDLLKFGNIPLPPYIKRGPTKDDYIRYQTVFAKKDGSIAAPTAGLHFDKKTLGYFTQKKVDIATVTLHIGPGTFRPVKKDNIENHKIESERYEVNEKSANIINKALNRGGKIFAVGTTTVRVLETIVDENKSLSAKVGRTNLFIYPPYEFKIVDHLITNFHLPTSTLLMLVSAFAGRDLIIKAYENAILKDYKFYSYGDVMLIL